MSKCVCQGRIWVMFELLVFTLLLTYQATCRSVSPWLPFLHQPHMSPLAWCGQMSGVKRLHPPSSNTFTLAAGGSGMFMFWFRHHGNHCLLSWAKCIILD